MVRQPIQKQRACNEKTYHNLRSNRSRAFCKTADGRFFSLILLFSISLSFWAHPEVLERYKSSWEQNCIFSPYLERQIAVS